jgi:hypothetical protein
MSMHPSPQAIRPRTWWLAALLTVVLAVISAGGLVLLAWGWYLVLPVWSILILVIAGTFFAVSRVRPWALPYGIAVLGSLPLAIVFVIAFLAVASSR